MAHSDLPDRPISRTGLKVPEACFGTMTFGSENTREETFRLLDMSFERGLGFLDAAELYPSPPDRNTQGRTEEYIGDWLTERKKRDRLILATKVVGRSDKDWFRDDRSLPRLNEKHIREAIAKSLRRLKTDYVDLYQLHWPDRELTLFTGPNYVHHQSDAIAPEETLEVLAALVQEGKVRAVGLSNETPWGVMRFLEAAERIGLPRVASIQNAYSLVNRIFETGLSEVAIREDVPLLAYSPLAAGALSGKYLGGAIPAHSRKADNPGRLARYETPGSQEAISAYVALARDLGMSPVTMALAFCRTRPFIASTIFGARSPEQLELALDAFSVDLDENAVAAIDAIHQRHPSPCP